MSDTAFPARPSTNSSLKLLSKNKVFGGYIHRYSHDSASTKTSMKFSIFLPPQTATSAVPIMYWLSGLTCTEENFIQKATTAYQTASRIGIAIVTTDTSPRGANVPGESDSGWDFGVGAGFYLNATKPPFNENYRMFDYVSAELPALIAQSFDGAVTQRAAIAGHSMGGLGALNCFLKKRSQYTSVSAFAPISHPSACEWGKKAFAGYLNDRSEWAQYDPTELIASASSSPAVHMKIDQGGADDFLAKEQLKPNDLIAAAKTANIHIDYRCHDGYDHSYFFISSFISEHIEFHAKYLLADPLSSSSSSSYIS